MKPAVTLLHLSLSRPQPVPVGLLSIAAVLDRAGYPVEFRDHQADGPADLAPERILAALDGCHDLVGISCMSDSLPAAVAAVRALKLAHPAKTVIMGGAGPTGVAEPLVAAFPFIDVVVVGEGERTVLELMDCLAQGGRADLAGVRGICYAREGRAHLTPPRERIDDLDELPLPLYEKADMARYRLVNIVFSRGCPFRCSFCDVAPMWGYRQRSRSPAGVVEEMTLLRDRYGKTEFEFTDETFVLRRDKVADLCERLGSAGGGMNWTCSGRVDLVSDELLAQLAGAGCQAMFFGIESGSDEVLARVRKKFTAREALAAVLMARRRMGVVASFIWGFPFETEQDLLRTLMLAACMEHEGVDARLNHLAPFPLSPLYAEHRQDLVWPEDGDGQTTLDPFGLARRPDGAGALVRRHPDVFPAFYRIRSAGFARKRALVDAYERQRLKDGWAA